MSEFKEYNGVILLATEAEFLEEMEKKIKKGIPCIEDRDKRREEIAKQNQAMLAQQQVIQAQAGQAQSTLTAQYQQVQAYEAQLDQQAAMSPEALEKYYESQYLATLNPTYKAQIQSQINMLIPSLGEDHPTVKQYKEMIDMDEAKAKQKAKSMVQYYTQYYKLRALNKEESHKMNESMYSPTITLEELQKVIYDYYNTTITPEYQTLLKETIDIGIEVLGEQDPNLNKLRPLLGIDQQRAEQNAQQMAQQTYQNVQNILQTDKASQLQRQQSMQILEQSSKTGVSDQPIRVGEYLGFVSDDKHVVGLNLFNSSLITLPVSIGNLSNLKILHLKWNKLEELPSSFGNLQALEELIIDEFSEISKLPDSFCDLKNLRKLECPSNRLKSLPDNFGQLSSLIELNLGGNKLKGIPDSIGNLTNLKFLYLRSNEISALPPSFFKLSKLNNLDLSFNPLGEIPEDIGQLNSLNMLYMMKNNLTELPKSIANLKSLKTLYLNDNALTELPEEILELSLDTLSLEGNQLSVLPYFIWQMESLKTLILKGNPLSTEEHEIARNDAETIKDYCRQRASIAIMLIYTDVDATNHRIPELIEFLEDQSEVFGVVPVDESNLLSTDLVLFLATVGSINSSECTQILKSAQEQGIGVVPLKGLDIGWGDLAGIGLSRELGHEFIPDNFNGFCESIYSYIQLLKRTHNIFKDKSGLIRKKVEIEKEGDLSSFEAFKSELSRIIHSQDLKECFNMYQSFLKPQYDNVLKNKAIGQKTFITLISQYFQAFMQSKGGGKM